MVPNILITGGSGYLGGDLLQYLKTERPLSSHGAIYALVRSDEQARKVEAQYDATPLSLDLSNQEEITQCLLEKEISIVFYLIDPVNADAQLLFITSLEAVGKQLKVTTHFLHTSGAKIMSAFVGMPTDRDVSDAESGLFDLQKNSKGGFELLNKAAQTCTSIIEAAEARGVRSYIFFPCIVYGKSAGFGNQISIQTVAIVRAAKATRQVCKADNLNGTWPVSSVHDNSTLYAALLRNMLAGNNIGCGKDGYYLASSGAVAWTDIYAAMAKALAKRGVVDTAEVGEPTDRALETMAQALGGPKEFVSVHMGGFCKLKADRGRTMGWAPKHSPEHILEAADDEVELILQNL